MKKMPNYIKIFMGADFRAKSGPDLSFNLKDCLYDSEKIKHLPLEHKQGCYIISTEQQQLTYANGKKSKIIYIGLSDDIKRRLINEHFGKHLKCLMQDKDFGLNDNLQIQDKYQYMLYLGAHVDVFYVRGNQNIKTFESTLIYQFYNYYRSMPVGNGARSFA